MVEVFAASVFRGFHLEGFISLMVMHVPRHVFETNSISTLWRYIIYSMVQEFCQMDRPRIETNSISTLWRYIIYSMV